MNEEEGLVSFETAKLAKEKGFNWHCRALYNESGKLSHVGNYNYVDDEEYYISYATPLQSVLQKWLREIHKIEVYPYRKTTGMFTYDILEVNPDKSKIVGIPWIRTSFFYHNYKSYEEALEEGLKKALALI